jgi:hypothetical protein
MVPGRAFWPTTGQVPTVLAAPVPTALLTALAPPLAFSWNDGARKEVPTEPLRVKPQPTRQSPEALGLKVDPNWL